MSSMKEERVFIIGDIHGCLDMLKRLMDKLVWRPKKDKLIFLGDYIDRGENSKGVVDYIVALTKVSPHVECLLGNHEAMFLDYIFNINRKLYLINGGMTTLKSYGSGHPGEVEILLPPDHSSFYRSLKSFIELDDYLVVHAGFRPGVEIEAQSQEDMIWIRDAFISSHYDFGKKVIFGHTPFNHPLIMKNKIGLDTGAAYGNRLTCMELPEMRFHSVEAASS